MATGASKIICTIGPASKNEDVLRRFEARDVFLARINLSHIDADDIEEYLDFLSRFKLTVAIDTEGSQIRCGRIRGGEVLVRGGESIRLRGQGGEGDATSICLTPAGALDNLSAGTLVAIDFNAVLLRVENVAPLREKGYVEARVIVGGLVGSNKGVHCSGLTHALPAFSKKDLRAVELAKARKIRHFTLSFIDNDEQVSWFKRLYPESVVFAKIETLLGVQNVEAILKVADGILIDRGDLSREIPIERIPLTQKMLVNVANTMGKDVFVASNLMETMADSLKPSRAEANDIINTVIDGATGFVLTKETAVGKYPVETVNMLKILSSHARTGLRYRIETAADCTRSIRLSPLWETGYASNSDVDGFVIRPHGGKLVERCCLEQETGSDLGGMPTIVVDDNTLMDVEQIAIGTYSPLEGFLCRSDVESVLERMRLSNGIVWPLPIILTVTEAERRGLVVGREAAIISASDGDVYAVIEVEEIYPFDRAKYVQNVYGTSDTNHPGVRMTKGWGPYVVGGRIRLTKKKTWPFDQQNMTPRQVRTIFEARCWSKVVGFHTRNVIHRSHEYIQMQALALTGSDGLFVQPIVGSKKPGDFNTESILQSYDIMIKSAYPKDRVVCGVLCTYSRYAGPREAVFTALCRQNFGCSHFIVGRDHTGVGSYYPAEASQEIFRQLEGIDIEVVFFPEVAYSAKLNGYVVKGQANGDLAGISGTEARRLLSSKIAPPEWFMRREISEMLINRLSRGERIFV